MKILNYGSLNIDVVFAVENIVRPGETLASGTVERYPGGKGLNQSIALARAGAQVLHGGLIGEDGQWLRELLEANGVDCRFVTTADASTGSAFIQVDRGGQNAIVLSGGSNRMNTRALCDAALSSLASGDLLLLQNEINCVDYLMTAAHERGIRVALNPSPMDDRAAALPLELTDIFILNELEGQRIADCAQPSGILAALHEKFPKADIVLTLGEQGCCALWQGEYCEQAAFPAQAVDTTGAGDTFTGYLLASLADGAGIAEALKRASAAAAIAVSRPGAASSIPMAAELTRYI